MIFSLIKKVLDKTINIEHWILIGSGLGFIVISSLIMYLLEPTEFNSLFNSFWFVMTTISQVGYGDFAPETVLGKLYSIILYIVGVGFFAIIIAKWIDLLNNYEELKEMEILGYSGDKHIVMINWSEKTRITIDEISGENSQVPIVIIDQMKESPLDQKNVHYIKGDPTKKDTLQRANVLYADSICIFASDQVIYNAGEDGTNLLIASTIKYLAKQENLNVYTIVEILDEDHISTTNKYFIDEFILSNRPFSKLMAKKALYK